MALFDKKRLTMPTQLQFPLPPHTDGVVLNKQTVKILPSDAQQSYRAGQTLRFKLQDQKAVDLQSIVLNVEQRTTGAQCSMDDWIGSLFRMVRVSFNGQQIERIDHYNRLHNALASFTVDEGYRQTVWGAMEGYWPKVNTIFGDSGHLADAASPQTPTSSIYLSVEDDAFPDWTDDTKVRGGLLNGQYLANRFSNALPTNSFYRTRNNLVARQFSIHFDLSGFLARHRKIFWIPLVNSIDIEILLAQDSEVLNEWNVTQTTQQYELLNPHIQCEMYTLSQEYVNALSLSMQQQGLTLNFDTYETRVFDINQSSTQQIVLNTRLSSLKTVYLFFYQPLPDAVSEQKRIDRTWIQQRRLFNADGDAVVKLRDYQLFIDGRPIQAHPMKVSDECFSESLWELQKSFRLHGDVSSTPCVSQSDYIDQAPTTNETAVNGVQNFYSQQHFMVGIDLEKTDLLSGHSVANQLYMNLNFGDAVGGGSSAPGPGVRMYAILHHDKNVVVYPGLIFEERM